MSKIIDALEHLDKARALKKEIEPIVEEINMHEGIFNSLADNFYNIFFSKEKNVVATHIFNNLSEDEKKEIEKERENNKKDRLSICMSNVFDPITDYWRITDYTMKDGLIKIFVTSSKLMFPSMDVELGPIYKKYETDFFDPSELDCTAWID